MILALPRTVGSLGIEERIGVFAHHAADQMRERGRETYEEAQAMFRRRPAESVAAAFGAGILVGVIVGLVVGSRD